MLSVVDFELCCFFYLISDRLIWKLVVIWLASNFGTRRYMLWPQWQRARFFGWRIIWKSLSCHSYWKACCCENTHKKSGRYERIFGGSADHAEDIPSKHCHGKLCSYIHTYIHIYAYIFSSLCVFSLCMTLVQINEEWLVEILSPSSSAHL